MAAKFSTRLTIYAALGANLLIAVAKFAAAAWTGSSAMLSEAFHSLVDTGNEILLLYGQHRADEPAGPASPLGHGRELYFWSFVVAVQIFGVGAVLSFYEGMSHILHPAPIQDPIVSYVVFGLSGLFEACSWWIAMRGLRRTKGNLSYWQAIRRSKDPPAFTVLLEDSAALIGVFIATLGTAASAEFGLHVCDGIASLGIGLILAATAIILAKESKELLIGEPADRKTVNDIRAIAASDPAILSVADIITVQLSPDQVVAVVNAHFRDNVSAMEVERSVQRVRRKVQSQAPSVIAVFVNPRAAAAARSFVA
jgi:cation diffusion facilitator family transporter